MALKSTVEPLAILPGWEVGDAYVAQQRAQLVPQLIYAEALDLGAWKEAALAGAIHLRPVRAVAEIAFPEDDRPTLLWLREADLHNHPEFVPQFRQAAARHPVGIVILCDPEIQVDPGQFEPYLLGLVPEDASERLVLETLRAAFDHLMLRLKVVWLEEDFKKVSAEMAQIQAIGVALSAERKLDRLLEMILTRAREITSADSGTIWVVEERAAGRYLRNMASQNDSVDLEHREFSVPVDPRSIAGWVALTGEGLSVPDVYDLPTDGEPSSAGSRGFDAQIGYRTQSMLAVPVRSNEGSVLGVIQLMNRKKDPAARLLSPASVAQQVIPFSPSRLALMQCLASQAGVALANAQATLDLQRETRRSRILAEVMRSFSERLDLESLLQDIMTKTMEVMDAERCTLFLVDPKTNELWSKVGEGLKSEIRFPRHLGIAGHVATTGETVNIPEAYDDPRFNQEFDKKTGYRTRTILCMPVFDEVDEIIGVTQVLNKREGVFDEDDERLLAAVCSQAAVALKNAQLFEDVLNMKNYNESILRSIATGVVTLDSEGRVTVANPAARRIFELGENGTGKKYGDLFGAERNPAIVGAIDGAFAGGRETAAYEVSAKRPDGEAILLNLNVVPLRDRQEEPIGMVVVAQDITTEQQLMSSLSRYVSREVAERVAREPQKLGGVTTEVAVLFSDIRSYTTLTENSTAAQIVALLNAYFGRTVPAVFKYRGMLDKYIGDAIMAVYGALDYHPHVSDFAVWSAIEMRRLLRLHNVERYLKGEPAIETGVGLCMGEATYGNIGSEERMDITVIGDTVNVSSRLEGLTKNFEQRILVSDNVLEAMAENTVPWVDLGEELVKGKSRPVRVYGISDSFIFGEIALPSIVPGSVRVLPDISAPLPELAPRIQELLAVHCTS